MANVTSKKILLDGPRTAVILLTGILDTSNASIAPAISLSDFTGNVTDKTLTGLAVDCIEYSITDAVALGVNLYWQATTPQIIAALAGQGEFEFEGGLVPDIAAAGFNGAINLSTTGWSGTVVYSILLTLAKIYR